LFIGGCTEDSCETGPASATIDRYDPQTRTISKAGRLLGPRTDAAAALLADGTVLLAGGWAGPSLTATVERFDPRRGVSENVGRMSEAQGCVAITLADNRVLLIGQKTVDVFDPTTGKIAQVSAVSPYRGAGTATLLADGRILTAGGGATERSPTADAHLLDPATGRVTSTGPLAGPRHKHAAARLLDGRVLMIGGSDVRGRDGGKIRALELYDPATRRFSFVGETRDARYKIVHAVVQLSDGRVLVAGGADKPEVIDPKTWTSRTVDLTIGQALNFASAVALPNGDVLVAGGYGERTISLTDRAWIIPRAAMA
jgi:hypothetical protein